MNIGFGAKQVIKMAAQNVLLPLWYGLFRLKKIDPRLVIFADAHHDDVPESMELLRDALKETGEFTIREMYMDVQEARPGAVFAFMLRFMRLYAGAGWVVISDNFLPAASCRRKSGTRVLQLWHACGAYKKFGYDAADDIPAGYKGHVYRNVSMVTVSSEACVAPFASAMRLPEYRVRPAGISRTDRFFDEEWTQQCRDEFYALYPGAERKKVVLWAPTFRGNAGKPSLPPFDAQRLQEELGNEWLVLTRVHPHLMEQFGESSCPIPTDRLFPVVDVLIADYSSLIFEYLLFERPLVLYVPDLEEYRARRGFYLDFDTIPGQKITRESALAGAVRQEYLASAGDKTYNKEMPEAFLETWMSGCDGHVTDRLVRMIRKTTRRNEKRDRARRGTAEEKRA